MKSTVFITIFLFFLFSCREEQSKVKRHTRSAAKNVQKTTPLSEKITSNILVADLDRDKIQDSVLMKNKKIQCLLSSHDFKVMESGGFQEGQQWSFKKRGRGFELKNQFNRCSYDFYFEYNRVVKKIQFIQYSLLEYGVNGGMETFDFITGSFKGDYGMALEEVKGTRQIQLPLYEVKIPSRSLYLASFNGELIDQLLHQGTSFREKAEDKYWDLKSHSRMSK
jgi:hypothetical protein